MISVADHPDGLWLFDGVCNFCSTSVRLVTALDRRGEIRFVPIQSAYGRHLAATKSIDPDQPRSFVFFDHGRALEKSAATLALLERMPRPWRWLGLLRCIPRAWRDALYDVVARHRYEWFGRRRLCVIPRPSDRAR
ncbi:MAG: DCC1-like thiol-disulfide oxidoreductase family protein [Caulobacteraceae bacterium]